MKSSTSKKLTTLFAVLAVGAFGMSYVFNKQQTHIDNEYQTKSKILTDKKEELKNLPEVLNKKLLKSNHSNSGQQLKQINLVNEKGKLLFTQLYKINSDMSDNAWKNRRELLTRYATQSALTATGLNYSEQGINRMYNEKIHVQKIKVDTGLTENNQIDGIVQVTYTDENNLSNGKEKIVTMYQFIYDYNVNKFTTLAPIGQLSSEQI